MGAFKQGVDTQRVSSIATTGGTTVLVYNSSEVQIFTGSLGHTVQLPDATTLTVGRKFDINNRSTGTINVNDGSGSLITQVDAGTQSRFRVSNIGSIAGTWIPAVGSSSGGSGLTSNDYETLTAIKAGANFSTTKFININPEEVGGDFWVNKTSIPVGRMGIGGMFLNGYGYAVAGNTTIGGSPTDSNDRYHPDHGYWLSRAVYTSSIANAKAYSLGSFGYMFGGLTDTSITRKYSDSTNSWSTLSQYSASVSSDFNGAVVNDVPHFYGYVAGVLGKNIAYNTSLDTYTEKTSGITAKQSGGAFALNNLAYFNGGNGNTTNCERYDSVKDVWNAVSSLNNGRQFASGFVSNGFGYAAAGEVVGVSALHEEYNDATGVWKNRKNLTTARSDLYCAPFSMNEVPLIVGGSAAGSTVTSTVESYRNFSMISLGVVKKDINVPSKIIASALINDISTSLHIQLRTNSKEWKNVTNNSSSALSFGESLNTKYTPMPLVFFTGGNNGGSMFNHNEFLNDVSNAWITKAVIPASKSWGSGFALSGYGFFASGTADVGTTVSNVNNRYNNTTDSWDTRAVITSSRFLTYSFELLNKGYSVAGHNTSTVTNTNYQFDDAANAWATKTATSVSKYGGPGAEFMGRGFIAGGTDTVSTNVVESYNSTTDLWVTAAVIPSVLYSPGMFNALGFLHVIGGDSSSNGNGTGSSSTNYKYNPELNSWSSVSGIGTSKFHFAGTPSNDYGFHAGGTTNGSSHTSQSEKYNSISNTWATLTSIGTSKQGAIAIKAGETLKYELRVGIPSFIAGIGAGVWVTELSTLTSSKQSARAFRVGEGFVNSAGQDAGGVSLTSDKYNADTRASVGYVPLPSGMNHSTKFVNGGFGYLSSGNDSGVSEVATTFRLDESTTSWTTKASQPSTHGRNGDCGDTLNGYSYSCLGANPGESSFYNYNFQYDPSANAWATKTSSSNPRDFSPGKAINGYYMQAGGSTGSQVSTVDKYNDSGNFWSNVTSLDTAVYLCASLVINDTLHIAGNASSTNIVQRYNHNINTWDYATSLNQNLASINGASDNKMALVFSGTAAHSNAISRFANTNNKIVLGINLLAQ